MKSETTYNSNFIKICKAIQEESNNSDLAKYSTKGWHKKVAEYLYINYNCLNCNITYYKKINNKYIKAEDYVTVPSWYHNNLESIIEINDWIMLRKSFQLGIKDEAAFFLRKGNRKGLLWYFNSINSDKRKNSIIIKDGEITFLSLVYLLREIKLPSELKNRQDIYIQWCIILGIFNNINYLSKRCINFINWIHDNYNVLKTLISSRYKKDFKEIITSLKNGINNTQNLENNILLLIELLLSAFDLNIPLGINIRGHIALRCTQIPQFNCESYFPIDICNFLKSKKYQKDFDSPDFGREIIMIELKDSYNRNLTTSFMPVYLASHYNSEVKYQHDENFLISLKAFLKFLGYSDILNIIEQNDYAHIQKEKEFTEGIINAKDSVISRFNHDIRIPLNEIKNSVRSLKDPNKRSLTSEDIRFLYQNVDLLSIYTENILSYSNIITKGENYNVKQTEVDLQKELLDIDELLRKALSKKGVKSEVVVTPNFPKVKITRIRFIEVAINLIANAYKYTEKGEIKIVLDFKNADNNLIDINFKVSDTGIGISEIDKQEIFNPYFRGSNANKEGIGLGLSIVKKALKTLNNATIEIESELNKGSIFSIVIPRVNLASKENIKINKLFYFLESCIENLILEIGDDELKQKIIFKELNKLSNEYQLPHNNTIDNLTQILTKLKAFNKIYSLSTFTGIIEILESSINQYNSSLLLKIINTITELSEISMKTKNNV